MAEEQYIYKPIDPVTVKDAEAALERDDPDELLTVVIAVGRYSVDISWAEAFCLRLAEHWHFNVRGNAIQSLGHLARRYNILNRPESIEALRAGLKDSNDYVRRQAEDAADDVEWFAKLMVRPTGEAG